MPTPVPAARQCLSPTAASALDAAVSSARRRAHAQTTSLHLISSLLAPPSPPLLRDALARARSAAYSPRVQLKALELCFAVSLDRLPSASSSGGGDEPPVSNSLMAAIKRSQANQRRNPDTFHFYQQAAASQTPAAVKVELSQLVLAILDDPVVSRVFGEAGFRSGDIKLAILRPAPPVPLLGRLPARSRPPPLFLCSFAAADDADVPSPAGSLAGAGEENCRRISEILSRGRNPMLVGVGAASAADDFAAASPYRILSVSPTSVEQIELTVAAAMTSATSGLIISIGDLKELVSGEADLQERGSRVVSEVTRMLEMHRAGRMWVMGWSATYETYLEFLSKFPLLDKDWELQLLPITSVRAGSGGSPSGVVPPVTTAAAAAFSKPTSMMESFVPFGGFFSDTCEANSLPASPCPLALRCQYCNDKYEQEVATIIKGSGIRAEDHHQGVVSSLLQRGSMVGTNNGFDAVKVRDDQVVLKSKILNLQKKWNDCCLRVHQGCQRVDRDHYHLFPHYIGVPADRERAANSSKGVQAVELQREVTAPLAISAFNSQTTAQSISLPSMSKKQNEDFVSTRQVRHSKSDEQLQDKGMQSLHGNLSDYRDHEDRASPSSAASVTTDLVLGTPRDSSSKEPGLTSRKHVEDAQKSICLMSKKADDLNLEPRHLSIQPYSCSQSSANVVQPPAHAPHLAASRGVSKFSRWQRPSTHATQSSDLSNYKLLVDHLFRVVGRQEEALSAVCQAIVRCRSMERRRGANRKNDLWFSFHGPDSMAKRRVAVALAELMYGNKENLIYLDLSLQDGDDRIFRGKTKADCIVEELSKKRQSVLFLDNIDKADYLAQDCLSHAIQTGRFLGFRGKEIDINGSIVVLSTRMIPGCKNVSLREEDEHTFSEEKILAARGFQLKIMAESGTAVVNGGPSGKVVVSPMKTLRNVQAYLFSGSVSKRKLNICDDQEKLQGSPGASKRPHRTSSELFDLNLPVEEGEPHDADSSTSGSHENLSSSNNVEGSVDNLFHSVDEAINFKPYDFDKLADDTLQEMSNVLRDILGPECRLEIDVGAMEQILAAAWTSEDRKPMQNWLDQVLATSLAELKRKCKDVNSCSTLRLVTCEEDIPVHDHGLGVLLPSRIILD